MIIYEVWGQKFSTYYIKHSDEGTEHLEMCHLYLVPRGKPTKSSKSQRLPLFARGSVVECRDHGGHGYCVSFPWPL